MYNGIKDVLTSVYKAGGVRALYRGVGVSLLSCLDVLRQLMKSTCMLHMGKLMNKVIIYQQVQHLQESFLMLV